MASESVTLNELLARVKALETGQPRLTLTQVFASENGVHSVNVKPHLDRGVQVFIVRANIVASIDRYQLNFIVTNQNYSGYNNMMHHYEYRNVTGGGSVELTSDGTIVAKVTGNGSNSIAIYSVYAVEVTSIQKKMIKPVISLNREVYRYVS